MAALFCSCSVSEDLEMEVPSADDCILEVAVGLGDGGKTRGLSGNTSSITATWQAGDKVLVYKDNTKVGELTPVSTGSVSTTLRGKLSGSYASYTAGSTLTLYLNSTETSYTDFTQDGTLATILANLRYQSATTTISKASDRPALTGTAVTFNLAANNPSINHFTLNQAMKTLRVSAQGSTTLLASATADSPTTDFYVAIPAAASQTYLIEGISEYPYCEYFQAKTAALSANKYYSASVNLTENPLTFEPVSATTTVTIKVSERWATLPDLIQYSDDDGVTWKENDDVGNLWSGLTWTVKAGQRLMVRFLWNNPLDSYNSMFYGNCFIVDQPCYVYGNIGSLLGADADAATDYNYCFYGSFSGQINIRSHPFRRLVIGLWGTSQVRNMYNIFRSMFYGCSGLTTAPVLDFSNWDTSSVEDIGDMFNGMFSGCSSLTTAPVLDLSMFDTGQVIDINRMFNSMFSGCTSLTTGPVLDLSNFDTSSVAFINGMFSSMFSGCRNLNAVKMKLTNTTILGNTSGFENFLTGAKDTGTLTVSSGTTSYWNDIKTAGYIPSGWSFTEE